MIRHETPPEIVEPLARQAEWTPSSVVERDVEHRRRRVTNHDWLALTVGATAITSAAILGICLLAIFFQGYTIFPALALIGGLFYLAKRIDLRRDRLQEEAASADRILREEFGAGQGWLVSLKILQGAAPSGEDRGMLWIEDGRLVFAGHRTSFTLSQDQVTGRCAFKPKVPGLRNTWSLPLNLHTPAGPVSLSLEVAESGHAMPSAINHWLDQKPTEIGQLPPTTLGPGHADIDRLLLNAVVSTVYWLFVVFLMTKAPTINAAIAIALMGGVAGLMLRAGYTLTRWQAWIDFRKVPK